MTTSQLPVPTTVAPAPEVTNLLTVVESGAACCGGSACGTSN